MTSGSDWMRAEPVLLVDAGNSRIKWGLGHKGRIQAGVPFCSRGAGLEQDLQRLWAGLPKPDRILVSNVAGNQTANALSDWSLHTWGLTPHFVRSQRAACGVINGYEEPEALGVDRWVALIAAHGLYREPLCIADCGTALTLDSMDAQGRHLGGLIAPGLGLMRQSLGAGTAALSSLPTGRNAVPACNTADAVQSGTLHMESALIERFARHMESRFGAVPRLLLTGGDAPAVSNELKIPNEMEPDLVLRGLVLIAEDAA